MRQNDRRESIPAASRSVPVPGQRPERSVPVPGQGPERSVPVPGQRPERSVPVPGQRPERSVPVPGQGPERSVPVPGQRPERSVPVPAQGPERNVPVGPVVSVPVPVQGPERSVPVTAQEPIVIGGPALLPPAPRRERDAPRREKPRDDQSIGQAAVPSKRGRAAAPRRERDLPPPPQRGAPLQGRRDFPDTMQGPGFVQPQSSFDVMRVADNTFPSSAAPFPPQSGRAVNYTAQQGMPPPSRQALLHSPQLDRAFNHAAQQGMPPPSRQALLHSPQLDRAFNHAAQQGLPPPSRQSLLHSPQLDRAFNHTSQQEMPPPHQAFMQQQQQQQLPSFGYMMAPLAPHTAVPVRPHHGHAPTPLESHVGSAWPDVDMGSDDARRRSDVAVYGRPELMSRGVRYDVTSSSDVGSNVLPDGAGPRLKSAGGHSNRRRKDKELQRS